MGDIYKYLILKDIKLIIQFHQNNLTLNGIKDLKQSIINDKDFNPDYGFIIDLRKANIVASSEELIEYGNWVAENVKLTGLRRLVMLTATPEQVAKTTIYSRNENIALNYSIFSTMEASLDWLQISSVHVPRIEQEIKSLTEF